MAASRKPSHRLLATLLLAISAWWSLTAQEFTLPSSANSVKFAAIGDAGSGEQPQYDIANQMTRFQATFPFDRVIMLGDNIYGGQGPQDLIKKFSLPYKALLDRGVKFYASLGNHDEPANRRYPLWNMGGEPYYSYATKNVRFFALDSNLVRTAPPSTCACCSSRCSSPMASTSSLRATTTFTNASRRRKGFITSSRGPRVSCERGTPDARP